VYADRIEANEWRGTSKCGSGSAARKRMFVVEG
jgi:hypothetical protein